MPLEGLRYDVTPIGMHYTLVHYDIPYVDSATWRLNLGGQVREPPHDCKRPLLSPRIQQHVAFPVRSAMRLDENHAFQC